MIGYDRDVIADAYRFVTVAPDPFKVNDRAADGQLGLIHGLQLRESKLYKFFRVNALRERYHAFPRALVASSAAPKSVCRRRIFEVFNVCGLVQRIAVLGRPYNVCKRDPSTVCSISARICADFFTLASTIQECIDAGLVYMDVDVRKVF